MKRLFLLRHAESPASYGLPDHERGLSDQGLSDARALGAFLVRDRHAVDHILCSSAARTRATLDGVFESFEDQPSVVYSQTLYQGSLGDYLAAVQGLDDDCGAVLIVGHNPVIHGLAAMLAADDGSAGYQGLMTRYSPGSLSVLDCACDRWADIQAGANALVEYVAPGDYGCG